LAVFQMIMTGYGVSPGVQINGKAVDRRDETAPAVDVLAEINRIQTSGAKTARERKAAKRDSVNTPVVPRLEVVADAAEEFDAVDTGHHVPTATAWSRQTHRYRRGAIAPWPCRIH
jgi:hypothetical protein